MSTADLFALPRNDDDVQVTWLLRLACATETDAGGAFSFEGLPEGEMALVLLLPSTRGVLPLDAPLPRIEVGRDRPTLDLGDIVLRAGEERSRE